MRDFEPLAESFFEQPVLRLAKNLIGKVLVTGRDQQRVAGRIVETEAYRGPEDRAAHSAGGRRTARTEAMFGPPGRIYMFVVYGRNWAFNVVAGRNEEPHAVLIRALEPIEGLSLMATRRRLPPTRRELSSGPGRLCMALGLNAEHYGLPLGPSSGIFLAEGTCGEVARSPRIRVDYAGEWAKKNWRFYERGNRWVSETPRD